MHIRRLVACVAAVAALAYATIPVRGQASALGQWSSEFSMPLVAVHAALMRSGDLLLFDAWEIPGTPSARLWNPQTNVYTPVPNGFAELFCAGHILSSDGRLLTTGGHNGAGVGTTDATFFDATTSQWTSLPNLNYARWYPSLIQLPDGRALTLGGAISRPNIAEVPEALAVGGSSWATFPGAQKDVGEYPLLFQAPDGRIFVNGFGTPLNSWLLNLGTSSWTTVGPSPAAAGTGVMYQPGKVMMVGGGNQGTDPVITATGVLDLNQPTPSWRESAPMAYGRSQHNLVILPDGKVLVVGGAAEVSLVSTNPVLTPEMWDPGTETWTEMAPMARPRMYHSIAILLPDGRVLAAGGGRLGPDELNGEFYSPPYLFRGTRPVVSSSPASVGFGSNFSVSTPDPNAVARVTLVRSSSVTHGINLDQRFFELPFTRTSGAVSVQAPADSRLAPAGDYLLFVLDGNGVPSVGRSVRLGGSGGAPSLVVNDVSVNEGTTSGTSAVFTVSLNGVATQTVTVAYATVDGTAVAGSDYAARSGTLTFPVGTTSATVSVPITLDAAVELNETFTLVLSGSVNATIADGTGVGTVVNDDVPFVSTVSIASTTVTEGSGGGTPIARFTVTLSPASAQDVIVGYRTLPGSAVAPDDYTNTTGTLTFAGGTTVQTIQVPVVPDVLVEANETFSVELFNPVNAQLGTSAGVATIFDDDSGTVTATYVIGDGANDVNEDGTTLAIDAPLWMGNGASVTSYLGLRFDGVSIPRGATITAARLEVVATASQWNQLSFEMGIEAGANSAPFSPTSPPSQRTLLTPRVQHASNTPWVAGTRYALDDITALVQAAVGQPAWASQSLTVVLRGTGSPWGRKHLASAEAGSATAPRLIVSYTAGGASNQPPTITSATATPATGQAPLVVAFSGAATDPEGAPLTYTWAFGNGQSATGANVSHTYGAGTFGATLTVSDGAQQSVSAPIVIQAGASLPTLSVADVTMTEGSGGASAATFTISRSAGGSTVTVAYATANGSATAPADYTATTGTLTLTGPTLSSTVTVPVVPDTQVESAETFTLLLSNPVGAVIADGSGTATILDDDGQGGPVTATFAVADGTNDVNEDGTTFTTDADPLWAGSGASAAASLLGLRFTGVTIPAGATVTDAHLELTASTTQWNAVAFEMAVEAAGNSAAFGAGAQPSQRTLFAPRVQHASDVQWVAGTRYALEPITAAIQALVNQPAWASGQAVSVIVRGTAGAWARKFARSAEGGASVAPRLVVSYTGGGGPTNQPPVITSATATPASGPAPLSVTLAAAATDPEAAPLTYTWTFGDGQTGTGATVSHLYAAGSYTATVSVSDGVRQTVSAPIAVQATSTLPTLSISDATVTEGQSGSTVASFTVTLSAPPASPVTVNYTTVNGSAVAPGDYTARSGTLTFTGSTTSQPIAINVVGDTAVEPSETFTVTLSSAANATLADATGVGTIVNDDSAGGPVTATYVVSPIDDVNEDGATFSADAGTAWLGNGASSTASYLGLRFTGVTIPAGAIITSAYVEVSASATQWNQVAYEQAVEASVNSAPFSDVSRPSQRSLLAPRVPHSSDAQWIAGSRYALDNIQALVQAAVQQPGWAAQSLTVVVRGSASAWARKFIASADDGAAAAPRLVVTYQLP